MSSTGEQLLLLLDYIKFLIMNYTYRNLWHFKEIIPYNQSKFI